jgi:tryptophanyl-tRNA synthetase
MRVFSGIRPTGELHLGNYLGAMKQWIKIQDEADSIFCVVDLHAVTTPYKNSDLQKSIMELATDYIAAGLDPEKCILFVQSSVAQHTELAWLLGTITPLGDLKRMTQFKEKSKQHPEYVNAGILNYPILMAADILLYQTDLVPVGKDQQQHVELTREIARRFNARFGRVFKEPRTLLPQVGDKIMSLVEPEKKMSKTGNQKGYIGLFERPEDIKAKIMAAKTDTGKEIKFHAAKKPGISNLLTIYALSSGKTISDLEKEFKGKNYSEFKKSLADYLVNYLESFRKKRKELLTREVYIKDILARGAKKAGVIAQSTMQEVKKAMGLTA